MADLILLDAESIFAFGSLYPGDISECVKGTYISLALSVRESRPH